MKVRRAIGISLLAALAFLGTTAESISCSGDSGNSQIRPSKPRPDNGEHVDAWCRNVDRNEPDTYVYRWKDERTGKSGFVRGFGNKEVHKRLHPHHRISRHC